MSDTHGRHQNLKVPDGDVLIHAGDFCRYGSRANLHEFGEWFSEFPHECKIVIAGNHDMALQKHLGYGHMLRMYEIEYLEDTQSAIQDGPKIWGSPYTPPFQSWAFMLEEDALARKFALIPDDVDVLVTHGPPAGVLDLTDLEGVPAGSRALSERLWELGQERPLVHIFGHIHERWGQFKAGNYLAYNVAICDFKYNPVNPCTVIEWNVPEPIDPSGQME
jgi:predicted phosphodiesterase